jgi:hypothetical protein
MARVSAVSGLTMSELIEYADDTSNRAKIMQVDCVTFADYWPGVWLRRRQCCRHHERGRSYPWRVYGHFSSKDELVALASLRAMIEAIAKWQKVVGEAAGDRLDTSVDSYLSLRHHNHPEMGCLLAALGTELLRQPAAVKEAVTAGQRKMLDFLVGLAQGKTKVQRRKQAVIALAAMIGSQCSSLRLPQDSAIRRSGGRWCSCVARHFHSTGSS